MIRTHNASAQDTVLEDPSEMTEVIGNVSSGDTSNQEPMDLVNMVPNFFS